MGKKSTILKKKKKKKNPHKRSRRQFGISWFAERLQITLVAADDGGNAVSFQCRRDRFK